MEMGFGWGWGWSCLRVGLDVASGRLCVLGGLWGDVLLLLAMDWSLLRAAFFSVWANVGTMLLNRWTWS